MRDAADLLHEATDATKTMRDDALDTVHETTRTAKDAISQKADSARIATNDVLAKNPLVLGIGAIAVGLLAGFIVPISAFEREKLGPVGARLTDRVKGSANEFVARGKSALTDAVSSALKSSKS